MAVQRIVTLPKQILIVLLGCAAVLLWPSAYAEVPKPREFEWATIHSDTSVDIHFYFFWSEACPLCQRAKPFVESLPDAYPWLELYSRPLAAENPENVALYVEMARAVGAEARSVPAFLFCGTMITGYGDASSTGAFLKERL